MDYILAVTSLSLSLSMYFYFSFSLSFLPLWLSHLLSQSLRHTHYPPSNSVTSPLCSEDALYFLSP